VLIIAYLIPVIILSAQKTGIPVPQFAYGQVLAEITELERTAPHIAPFVGEAKGHATAFWFRDPLNFFGLIFCLMVGTASLPHVIMRYFTTPSVREARKSVGWSLLFIFILYFTAPAYAVFAKYEVFTNILGRDIGTLQAVQALPSWIFTYGNLGLVKICGANAASPEALLAACQAKGATLLDFSQFSIAPDTIVLATPEIAGLPYVIAGLVAAGGLAAALSTADGLLLAIANALSHDVYYKMIDHRASTKRRLVVARILLVLVALLGAWTAVTLPQSILIFVSWAFSVAASGLFAALVLGVFWKRCTSVGAIAGMISGFLVCVYYTFGTEYYGVPLWFQNSALTTKGLSNIAAGVIGIPVSFLVTIVVSLLTPAPSRQMQEFIDAIRVPRGEMVMGEAAKAD